MSIARHHAEWLSLVEVSGPFLSLPVLVRVFPQGLDAHDPEHLRALRLAHDAWEESQATGRINPAPHRDWVRFVLAETLGHPDEVLAEGQAIPQTLKAEVPEHGETLRPDLLVKEPEGRAEAGRPRLLVRIVPPGQDLEKPVPGLRWKVSHATRMAELLRATGLRLGLLTNGEQWMLVDAPRNETTGFASWYASLWLEEPITLRAFRSLLSARRFFGVPADETLEALLTESASDQAEVTDQLGYQVRKAVEVLIQSLDRSDQDHGRDLLRGVSEARLYEAALTVMMRLVFLFSAEERGLLVLGDPLYDQHYAVSTLRAQLREAADQHGEEVLERRFDAWSRILATFRAVHGGIDHERLVLPAYGGRLFDPDRFPFLEGRKDGTSWRQFPATPLPIDNRTVLHLLEALQVLQVKVPGGGPAEARRLSFRALDIEQIGHVYEGLLDHTAKRADEPYLGLAGTQRKEPEVRLSEIERLREKGDENLLEFLREVTGRSPSALKKAFSAEVDGHDESRFRVACGNDGALWDRVCPFAGLVHDDTFGHPAVVLPGSVFVTEGTDRRSTGTHYTPRSLTESIVQHTLEPLVYGGPADGKPPEEWTLRSAREILALKVCDMATGSGAFLVQACRYLSERLLEAWEEAEATSGGTVLLTPEGEASRGESGESVLPADPEERLVLARRLVAQRSLHGVDKNPLAVEMAKLSLWLLTLAKDRPFTFLDHAIRHGDSLVGIHDLGQLRNFSLDGHPGEHRVYIGDIEERVRRAADLRRRLEAVPARDIRDVEAQEEILRHVEKETALLRHAADLIVAPELKEGGERERGTFRQELAGRCTRLIREDPEALGKEAEEALVGHPTFHWPLEFPEVVVDRGGFDAIMGNPPFMGGKKITGNLGKAYREFLVEHLAGGVKGHADLCAYFFLRASHLVGRAGRFGMLATNTLAQGDTREVGLEQVAGDSCVIPRAIPSRKWPGTANLEVAIVWGQRGAWNGEFVLDDKRVAGITAFLTAPGAAEGKPHRLAANAGKAFQGSNVLGLGFVLEPSEAQRLIASESRNREVLFPYLNGEDLNSRPDQSPSRWVINFLDWPLDQLTAPEGYDGPVAANYPDCLAIVRQKVKPERDLLGLKTDPSAKGYARLWWQYARRGLDLYATIASMKRVLVAVQTSKYVSMSWVPAGIVYSHATVVFALSDDGAFAALSCSLHTDWVIEYCSSLETRLRYIPTDVFETFPFPSNLSGLESIGERYHEHRRQIMLTRQEGLTKTYNRFHDPKEAAEDIQKLRDLHVEMDQGVATTYGWADLDLGHGFHETRQGLRFTLSEPARRDVLGRLLRLNHERYEEEVRQDLHDARRKRPRKPRPAKPQVKKAASPRIEPPNVTGLKL